MTWTTPSGVAGIAAYDLRFILTRADETVDANWTVVDDAWTSGPLQYVLTGLVNDSSYDVQVRAVTTGDGAWSATAAATPAEAGTTHDTALALRLGAPLAAAIGSGGDVDLFRLTVARSTRLALWTAGGNLDTRGLLTDDGGNAVASSDNSFLHTGERHMFITAFASAGDYYVKVTAKRGDSGPYRLHALGMPATPGNSLEGAAPLVLGVPGEGRIDPPTDVDYWRLDLAAAADVFLRAVSPLTRGIGATGSVDIDGALLDGSGNAVDTDLWEQSFWDRPWWLHGFTMRDRLEAGTYYVRVSRSGGHALGFYRILAVEDTVQQRLKDACSDDSSDVSDPGYACQWHLKNTGQTGGKPGEDINVEAAWDSGAKGDGATVVVVADGFDYHHEDLADNVDESRNHDWGPRGEVFDSSSWYGTRAAGIVAARDNDIGGRGVAPRATIWGHRLAPFTTVPNVAEALTRNADVTAVSTVLHFFGSGPHLHFAWRLWEEALDAGVADGYGGKGTFFVLGSGNGGETGGYSSFDEMASHRAVTAVCAVDDRGIRASYSEMGANLWICAPSGDTDCGRPGVFTTDSYSRYIRSCGRTGAAASVVSGVAALIRGVNSSLGWRDVKLILAGSARKVDSDNAGWRSGAPKYGGGGGRYAFNHEYGFGVVDAGAAVALARNWTNVPKLIRSEPVSVVGSLTIPDATSTADGATVESNVRIGPTVDFIEFVEVTLAGEAPAFRDLLVELVSPTGAVSELSVPYRHPSGNRYWLPVDHRFGSARHLGERSEGQWSLRVTDRVTGGDVSELESWSIRFQGHRSPSPPIGGPGGPGGAAPPVIDSIRTGPGSLTVSWSAPAGAGSAVVFWDLRLIRTAATDRADEDWTVLTDLAADSLRATVSGLAGETSYDVQVRAVTAAGAGPWSTTASGRTEAVGPPPPSGPPEAAFTVAVDCPEDLCRAKTGERVRFQDTSAGVVRRRTWDFGDGRKSTSASPSHVWSSPGFYTVTLTVGDGTVESTASRVFLVEAFEPAGTCVPDATTSCLRDSRFQVRAEWWTAAAAAAADVVWLGTNDSGVFQFFGQENWEVLIKVLDGCAINGHVWVFGASATDLGLAVEVTDTVTGETRRYAKEPGPPALAITDNRAFAGSCAP